MTKHRFLNEGRSPIPMGGTAEYACICGRRGTYAAIERHVAESRDEDSSSFDEEVTPRPGDRPLRARLPSSDGEIDVDFGGGETKAHYLPVEPRAPAPPMSADQVLTPSPSHPLDAACPICAVGKAVADLPEIAAWSCGHWIRKRPHSIAEAFQDMLRIAYQAGAASAATGEIFETWYQREVLQ